MPKDFDVSLVVASRKMSLVELNDAIGESPDHGSHSRGEPRDFRGRTWNASAWRKSARDESGSLESQCLQLLREIPRGALNIRAARPDDISIYLDIGCFFQSAYAAVSVSPAVSEELAKSGVSLELSAYPCSDDGPQVAERSQGSS